MATSIIQGFTLAVTNITEMVLFYSNVFHLHFDEKEMYGTKMYAALWGELNVLFCPAEIAKNTAIQNRHQFDIFVSNLDDCITLAKKYGGELIGETVEDDKVRSIGIYDPDHNSMVIKQLKLV
ncbi:MAG: hypothetical protein WBG90_04880 [Saonia sp.]